MSLAGVSCGEDHELPPLIVRRAGLFTRDHELLDGAALLARLTYAAVREAGEVQASDGRRWTVERSPGFGPWVLRDHTGAEQAQVTKPDAFRERFTVIWAGADRLELKRVATFGRRRLEVLELPSQSRVGSIEQRDLTGRETALDLPVTPDEVVALVAWLVGMLVHRDTAAVASQQ